MKTFDINDKSELEELLSQISDEAQQEEKADEEVEIPSGETEENPEAELSADTESDEHEGEIDLDALASGGVSSKALEAVKKQLEEQKVANNVLEDKVLRIQADFENYKRRTREDTFAKIARSKAGLLKELLALCDNFGRAASAAETDKSFENLLEGMNMLSKLLMDILAKENVKEIESVGQPFNPEIHDCILAVNNPDVPKETIMEEVEKGYVMGDVVLRPAKVIVSSGNFEE